MRSPRALASWIPVLAGALGALACACGGEDTRPAQWRYLHAAIIAPSCASASCHSRGTQAGGLAFEDQAMTYQTFLEGQYVIAGDPQSPLIYLLEGRERDRMPPDNPLPRADIQLIQRWIEEGAMP
ncbi:MAG TPA: hypothetical protein VND93_32310 [Myxococcales bacterium]|nr:hypothetical protein [Myxococcales bacterium]